MISPGRLIYQIYYGPKEAVRKTVSTGIIKTIEIERGKKLMKAAALDLKEIVHTDESAINVYFLTGKKYWFQTAFCLHSLQLNAGINAYATLIDDGSFDDELEAQVLKQFPTSVKIIRSLQLNHYLNEKLPEENFPVLRRRRLEYPHLRKLTDVHVIPGHDLKLVLDSDMLFFHKPIELIDWFSNSNSLLFMRDVEESYGYSSELMTALANVEAIPSRLNVGVAGMPSHKINWDDLEHWTKSLLEKEGSSYLQEQALTAMVAAREPIRFLDENAYKVLPKIKSDIVPEVLHHYVADSKYDYFVKGWRQIVRRN